MTSNASELPTETLLERLVQSVEASVPGLSLQAVVGDLRPALKFFPDRVDEAELAVDPDLCLRELGVVVTYDGDDGWGYRGSVTSDASIERWAHFAEQLLANIQEILVDSGAEAWPQLPGRGGQLLAAPRAVVENGVLHMWFGERVAPILSFAPVRLIP